MLALVLAAPFVLLVLIGLGSSALRWWRERQALKQWHQDVAERRRAATFGRLH